MRPIRFRRKTALSVMLFAVAVVSAACGAETGAAAPAPGATGDLPAATAPPTAQATSLLRQVAQSVSALDTFEADFVQTQHWVGMPDSPPWKGVLYLKRPNLFRLEYSDPPGHLQVSDGHTVWTYVPENKEVLSTQLGEVGGKGGEAANGSEAAGKEGDAAGKGGDAAGQRSDAAGNGREAAGKGGDLLRWILENGRAEGDVVNDAVAGKPAREIALRPPEGAGLSEVRIWTAVSSPELLQYEITDASGNQSVYRLTRVRKNPKLSDGLFHFKPPPGVPVVELGSP